MTANETYYFEVNYAPSYSYGQDANYCVVDGRVEEKNKPTIILKSKNRSRLKDLSETEKAEYKIEYENSVRQKTC